MHMFFGGPKGLAMHFCDLKAVQIFINYDIDNKNLAVFLWLGNHETVLW